MENYLNLCALLFLMLREYLRTKIDGWRERDESELLQLAGELSSESKARIFSETPIEFRQALLSHGYDDREFYYSAALIRKMNGSFS